jgi:hypothetical protein
MQDTVEINGVRYVRAESMATNADLPLVMVRQAESGVHFGYLAKDDGRGNVTLFNARRVWYWKGAATLSQLALDGPSAPDECKFPAAVPEITIYGICEMIPITARAAERLNSVPVWSA